MRDRHADAGLYRLRMPPILHRSASLYNPSPGTYPRFLPRRPEAAEASLYRDPPPQWDMPALDVVEHFVDAVRDGDLAKAVRG